MKRKNKLFLSTTIKSVSDEEDYLVVEGMASTDDVDRMGDVVVPSAWIDGVKGFSKNPIILFNHNYSKPVGKATEVEVTPKGLRIVANIYKAAADVYGLVKSGVLQAFSVGFLVKEADYDSASDIFVIKQAELLEVSVVAVPANGEALFSVRKSFDNENDYSEFKNSVVNNDAPRGQSAKLQEKKMDENEIQDIVKRTAKEVADALEANRKAAEAEAKKAAEELAAKEAQNKATEEAIKIAVVSGAQKLMEDIKAEFSKKEADFAETINKFQKDLEEKSEELNKMRRGGVFADRSTSLEKFLQDNEGEIVEAKILGSIFKKGWDTKLGKNLMEKVNTNAGVTVPTVAQENFETTVSTSLERDVELALVIAPLFRTINLNSATMVIPTMPDAGYAQFLTPPGTDGSGSAYKGNLEKRGDTVGSPYGGIGLGSKVLSTHRLISKSYLANEVEEDAIIPILPLIREAMTRSHARAVDHALLLGNPASPFHGYDLISTPYAGLVTTAISDSKSFDLGSSPTTGNVVTNANILNLRQAMGKYGLNPNDVIYLISMDAYYDLLDDTEFQNLDEVGAQATKVTGQVGRIFGTNVLVSDEFPAKANGAPFAVAVNVRNFVQPILRGMTVESEYSVENQRLVLLSTQRRGFDRIFSTAGQVVVHTW